MPIGAGDGFMKNSGYACDSWSWQMRPASKMRELAFNLFPGRLCVRKILCALDEYCMKLLKSVDLFESALSAFLCHFGKLLPEVQRSGTWTDLLVLVPTILHQWFSNDLKSADCGEQKGYPGVVELLRWNGKHRIDVFSAKRHRGTRHHGMVAENCRGASVCESFLPSRVKLEGRPQTESQEMRVIVDDIGIAESRHNVARFSERLGNSSKLVAIPDIVLISQRDDRSPTQRDALLEIPGGSKIGCIDLDSNRKRNAMREVFKNGNRAVRGAVVADHEFIRNPLLSADAFQLSWEKAFSVERAHRNGDGERRHLGQIPKTYFKHKGWDSTFLLRGAEVCST